MSATRPVTSTVHYEDGTVVGGIIAPAGSGLVTTGDLERPFALAPVGLAPTNPEEQP